MNLKLPDFWEKAVLGRFGNAFTIHLDLLQLNVVQFLDLVGLWKKHPPSKKERRLNLTFKQPYLFNLKKFALRGCITEIF